MFSIWKWSSLRISSTVIDSSLSKPFFKHSKSEARPRSAHLADARYTYPQIAGRLHARCSAISWTVWRPRPDWPAAAGNPTRRHARQPCLFVSLSSHTICTATVTASWRLRNRIFGSQLFFCRFLFWVKSLPFCRAQGQKSWIHQRGPRRASRSIVQRDPARSEPTESPERLWSCFALWLLCKEAETPLLRNIYRDVKLRPDLWQTHVGKATPMRILPRG